MSKRMVLNNVRLRFARLFVAEQFQGAGEFRYNASFLIDKDSETDNKIKDAIKEEMKAVFKEDADKRLRAFWGSKSTCCYTDDADDPTKMMLRSNRNKKDRAPAVLDRAKNVLSEEDGVVYAGCYVNADTSIWIQTEKFPGIRCTINAVQFYKDGDAFSAVVQPTGSMFEEIPEENEEPLI